MPRWATGLTITAMVAVLLAVLIGVHLSAASQTQFWQNFIPNLWANIIGVSIAAIIGVPIGFTINHFVATASERRRHGQQVREVRGLLEQVKVELELHSSKLFQLTTSLLPTIQSTSAPAPLASIGTPFSKSDPFSTLILQDIFGKQFIGNRSVLEIGEALILFRVCIYYERVNELNRHITYRLQDAAQPQRWDQKIAEITQSVMSAQSPTAFEIDQAISRLKLGG